MRYFKLTSVHECLFLFFSKKTCFLRSFLVFSQDNRNPSVLFLMLVCRDKDCLCLWGVWCLIKFPEKNIHWVNQQITPLCPANSPAVKSFSFNCSSTSTHNKWFKTSTEPRASGNVHKAPVRNSADAHLDPCWPFTGLTPVPRVLTSSWTIDTFGL